MKVMMLILFLLSISIASQGQRTKRGEQRLIKSGQNFEKMRVVQVTDSLDFIILRNKSLDIPHLKRNIWDLLSERMLATVNDPNHAGVGIAAPQVSVNRRLILVQRFDKDDKPFETIFNPEIIYSSDSVHSRIEGCLSIPEIRDTVTRSWTIEVLYYNSKGKKIQETVEGFTARIFQHEIDHLNGILFTDRIKH
ncbi:MAG: peptide deformylase [Bacteroidetes bacterium HGW-Bacteroidetes-1]|jgi:peptide deformylase|nr:MAG: peptide deformylase [Bacteroidetes bacterium HGW-Bacteroidetes-1]